MNRHETQRQMAGDWQQFIFRGALDVGATTINEEMKIATVKAIANLARAESSDIVAQAYANENLSFGPNYMIPKPFDPRLISEIAPAVAQAAMDSGVATRPIENMEVYVQLINDKLHFLLVLYMVLHLMKQN